MKYLCFDDIVGKHDSALSNQEPSNGKSKEQTIDQR